MKKIINIFGCICLMTVPIFSQELSRKQVIASARQSINAQPLFFNDSSDEIIEKRTTFGNKTLMGESVSHKVIEEDEPPQKTEENINVFFVVASIGIGVMGVGILIALIGSVVYFVTLMFEDSPSYFNPVVVVGGYTFLFGIGMIFGAFSFLGSESTDETEMEMDI